jgi:hypothetical protein
MRFVILALCLLAAPAPTKDAPGEKHEKPTRPRKKRSRQTPTLPTPPQRTEKPKTAMA